MKYPLRAGFLLAAVIFSSTVFAQNILISYQKSDGLFVCGTDTFFVQVKNTGLVPLAGAALHVLLPPGITYQPGSILGAIELNLTNLSAPVFGLPALPGGATAATAFLLHADCLAAAALDAGQVFVADLQVTSPQGNAQILTSSFALETGLLLIDSVDQVLLSGGRDDTLFRKIWVRNTRLGRIGALHVEDEHLPGLEIMLPGAATQANGSSFSEGEYDGAFFTAFGDGDTWLELGETACFTERIIITDCGVPAFSNPSVLRVGWGCGGQVCRYDSVLVSTMIQTSTKVPDLQFTRFWTPPVDNCGNLSSPMRLQIKNQGGADANDVLLNLQAIEQIFYGMDAASFRLVIHGDTTALTPGLQVPMTLAACSKEFASGVSLLIPKVPAQDSLDLLFDTYYCVNGCSEVLGTFIADYFYRKRCPENGFVSDTLVLAPDGDYLLQSSLRFAVGSCLQENGVYPMSYFIQSKRLVQEEGFLHINFSLPRGLSLDTSCLLLLGGVPPTSTTTNAVPGQPSQLTFSFSLPLPADSLVASLCLRYNCMDSMDCTSAELIMLPDSGGQFTIDVDPSASCGGKACYLPLQHHSYWTPTLNTPPDCGIGVCEAFKIAVERCFPGGEPNENPGDTLCCDTLDGLPNSKYVWGFKTYRTNFGLPDQDNNRLAEGPGEASGPGVRRDRYLPGDTMRVEYQGYVVAGGGYQHFGRVLWHEIARSDIGGPEQNDAFSIQGGQHRFVNADSCQYIGTFIRIRYADGVEVNCDVNDKTYESDQHLFSLHLINTIPPLVLDELVSQRHIFKADLNQLYTDGCLPKSTLDAGDSLFLYTDFRIRTNLTPKSSNYPHPPLIGFRTAVAMQDAPYAWNDIASVKSQYSGFQASSRSNLIGIKPCENSTTVRPYNFRLRIARENMFPFEVRPLGRIEAYVQSFPEGSSVQSARLLYLALQDSIPRLSNVPLDFAVSDTSTVEVDFDPVFTVPLDEGFALGATVQFLPDCRFEKADSSYQNVTYLLPSGFAERSTYFAEPDTAYESTLNGLGFYSNHPQLSFLTTDTIVYMPTGDFAIDFTLRNDVVPSVPNLWVAVVSPSGQAQAFKLLQISPPQTLSGGNGIFQLGQLNGFSQRDFRLQGHNQACDQDSLWLVFGWGCAPFTDPDQLSCNRDTFVVDLRLQSPELELTITQQPTSIPLCTESDYFELEIYNAKTGHAFDPYATVQLPSGLRIVPGSCQLAYPVGSAYQPIADPQALPGNFYQWVLNDIQATIDTAGLPGVELDPQNALRIRFRTLAECGFVSNAQPFFGTSGQSACGRETNVLNKPGQPLLVTGLGADYGVTMSLQAIDNQGVYCGGIQQFQLTMLLGGPPASGDSVYLSLPAGATLVTGSYQPLQNAPGGPPALFPGGFRLPLPTNAGAGTVVQFRFSLAYAQIAGCTDRNIIAQTRVRSEAFCASLGAPCTVYVATGEALAAVTLQHPELVLGVASFNITAGGQTTALVTVNNVGMVPASGVLAQVWQDVDANGALSAADVLLQTLSSGQTLAPNSVLQLSAAVNFNTAAVCHLLMVLPAAENCTCADRVLAIQDILLQHEALLSCTIGPVTLGVSPQPGASYQWQVPGVACDSCATTVYQPVDAQPGHQQSVFLKETLGDCSVLHRFIVEFGTVVSISLNNAVICAGQTATLTAMPAGASYQWAGPGLVNATLQQQTVQPNATATFSVTALFTDGCSSTATTTVAVLPADSLYLPPITTCQGVPAAILDKVTALAGWYTLHLSQANGCDSVLLQQLLVRPTPQTAESRDFCAGDTLTVFDTLLTQGGQVCRTYAAANGCDSVHCITATRLPLPALPSPDTLFGQVGQLTGITGPTGFVQYVWSPAVPGCTNCSVLQVLPDSIGLYPYLLTVTDEHGCSANVTYRLLVFPPCDPQRIQIPNAFTPNGDGVNDVFKALGEGPELIASLSIYDRWGEKVYARQGNVSWDGTIDGQPAMSDVYVYIIEVACGTDKVRRVGEVTVLR